MLRVPVGARASIYKSIATSMKHVHGKDYYMKQTMLSPEFT